LAADNPIHILVVDDEPEVRSALRRGLEAEGYAVSETGSRKALLQRLEEAPPVSLITLDLMLGHDDGLLLARQIRAKRNVPIIMITARNAPIDRVTGLEHGADDYIVKPFHIREVLLRIRAALRRYELEGKTEGPGADSDTTEERYEFEVGVLDVKRRAMTAPDGTEVVLTDAEFDILVMFLRHPGRVLSRDDITMKLKGRQWSPMDRTMDGHIARLRKKIEPRIEKPRVIKTVWRVGYVLAGDVQRLS
jgi:two-component system OmpR family response regulator